MKFINLGEPIKIRQGTLRDCYWITLRKNETIELPKKVGKRNGLRELKTTEGQLGDKVVETKQISTSKVEAKLKNKHGK